MLNVERAINVDDDDFGRAMIESQRIVNVLHNQFGRVGAREINLWNS